MLLQNAAAKGAEVIEECRVTAVEFPEGADPLVTARGADGQTRQWRARFVVDASGRDTLLAGQMGVKERNPRNNSAAIFGHFTGARRLEGKAEGNITIVWFDHGWFWFIPLSRRHDQRRRRLPGRVLQEQGHAICLGFFTA